MLFGYNSSREGGVASHSQGSLVDISTRLNLEFMSFSFCMIEIVNITNIRASTQPEFRGSCSLVFGLEALSFCLVHCQVYPHVSSLLLLSATASVTMTIFHHPQSYNKLFVGFPTSDF